MRSRRSIPVSLIAAGLFGVAVTGCRIGGLATQGNIAREPAGLRLMLEMDRQRLYGELLEVRPEGLLLHVERGVSAVEVDGSVVLVLAAVIPRQFRAGTNMPVGAERGRLVTLHSPVDREWLTGLSRFPHGMTSEVEARLLEAYGETRVHRLGGDGDSGGSGASGGGGSGDVAAGGHGGSAADAEASAAFLGRVERAATLYADSRVAVRHGYRLVGPDFPGMGQHWVNPGRVLSGGIDPDRPQILTYVDAPGGMRLTGMAFAVPLSEDEALPAAPVPAHVWHDHGGSLDEESLILESPHSAEHDDSGPRLAMFHAWLWPENPSGPFAQNNWALPWIRVGLAPPSRPAPVVARALSLSAGGAAYYRRLLRRVAELEGPSADPPSVAARGTIDGAVDRAAERADEVLRAAVPAGGLAARDEERLRDAWWGLWDDLRAGLDPAIWRRLEPAYREWGAATDPA